MYSPTVDADTLDTYIEKLIKLKERHGGKCFVMTCASDYPEGANTPYYVNKSRADGYTPEGTIVLG